MYIQVKDPAHRPTMSFHCPKVKESPVPIIPIIGVESLMI